MLMAPGQKKPVIVRNQFGGNFGGPVVLPKLINGRDRLFFFINYEATRERTSAADGIYRVPTEAERRGDFSGLLRRFPGDRNYLLWDPASTVVEPSGATRRTPFPNNMVTPINPQSQEMLGIYPMPNGYTNPANPADLRNYRTFQAGGLDNWRIDSRVDYRITQNDNVYVTYGTSKGTSKNRGGIFPPWTGNPEDSSYVVTVNYARVFSPSITNEFILGLGQGDLWVTSQAVRDNLANDTGLRKKYFKNSDFGRFPGMFTIPISGYSTIGVNNVWRDRNPTWQISDNVSWVRQSHVIKMGFNYFYKKEWDFMETRYASFDTTFTRAGTDQQRLGGDGVATFLLGIPTTVAQMYKFTGGNPDAINVMAMGGAYIDDKWSITRRLTLGIGLRWDLVIPLYSPNRYGNATIDYAPRGWQLAIPGVAQGYNLRFVPVDKNNFAPRLSVAYELNKSTVLRSSYGVFFVNGTNTSGNYNIDNSMNSTPGYVTNTYNNARYGIPDDIPHLKFSEIFPAPVSMQLGTYPISTGTGAGYFTQPTAVSVSDKESGVVPYYQRYMFEVQRRIRQRSVLSLTYSGARGTKLPYHENVNKPAYRTGWPSTAVYNAARPNNVGYFTDVWLLRQGLNSFYNGATVKYQHDLSGGLQFLAFYTFSKTVSDYVEYKQRNISGDNVRWPWNRKLGRGELLYSHPHRLVGALTYATPWGSAWKPLPKALAWGWKISGILTAESGNSITAYNGMTSARDYEPNMPNVACNPNLPPGDRTFRAFINAACFSAPPLDVKGNAGTGIVRGPGVNNLNMSFAKTFLITERLRMDFRGDMLNSLNHPQWSSINSNYSNATGNTFGWVTGGREPRIVNFTLKLAF
jgi:hypothetical protein